jgi:uncharacterized membrane protein YfcA
VSIALLIAIAVLIALAAATQSIFGFGYALLVVPCLTVLLGPKVAVVASTSVGTALVAWNSVRWRHDILWREAVTVSIAALCAMPLGLIVLTRTDDRTLRLIVGCTIIAFTVWLWRGLSLPLGRRTEIAAGATSGVLAASVGVNGPPLVIAFQATGMQPAPFRATLQVTFLVQAAVALTLFWSQRLVVADVGWVFVIGLPAAAVGALVGDRISSRVREGSFRSAVLVLLALTGVLAVASALWAD